MSKQEQQQQDSLQQYEDEAVEEIIKLKKQSKKVGESLRKWASEIVREYSL